MIPLVGLWSPPWTLVYGRGSWKNIQIQYRSLSQYWFEGVCIRRENLHWLSANLNASLQQCHPLMIKHSRNMMLLAVPQYSAFCHVNHELKISCTYRNNVNKILRPTCTSWFGVTSSVFWHNTSLCHFLPCLRQRSHSARETWKRSIFFLFMWLGLPSTIICQKLGFSKTFGQKIFQKRSASKTPMSQ